MKAQLWVETHQPVPLVPLSMLRVEPGDVVYIGEPKFRPFLRDRNPATLPDRLARGWFQAGPNGLFVSLDTADYFWDDGLDYDRSMGRRLQPKESVLVRYTSR